MAYSVYNSHFVKAIGVSFIMLLTACNPRSYYKHQVTGDEFYLNTAPLAELRVPDGMTLPTQSSDYNIPKFNENKIINKAPNILPPLTYNTHHVPRTTSSIDKKCMEPR